MTLKRLLKIVHRFGGILGPAHPFGVKSSSAMYFKKMNMELIERFDFIETFNTCESDRSNELAKQLAEKYDLTIRQIENVLKDEPIIGQYDIYDYLPKET